MSARPVMPMAAPAPDRSGAAPAMPAGAGALVLCGDWDVDTCGCGSSEAATARAWPVPPEVLDPLGPLRATIASARAAARAGRPVVLVYPTRSTVRRLRPLAAFAAAALVARRNLRLHLHEYRVFHELRWALDGVIALGRPLVVVSSEGEAEVLRRSLAHRLRQPPVVVVPATNAAVPLEAGPSALDAIDTGTVGLFGYFRPDKGIDLALEVLGRLPEPFTRLETVGAGWDEAPWPDEVLSRYTVVNHGPRANEELPGLLAGWQLGVASFVGGANDGRNSLRTPLAYGIPTLTTVTDPDDLTLRPVHLVVADPQRPQGAVDQAVAISADRDLRRRGAEYVHDFERKVRTRTCEALLRAEPRA